MNVVFYSNYTCRLQTKFEKAGDTRVLVHPLYSCDISVSVLGLSLCYPKIDRFLVFFLCVKIPAYSRAFSFHCAIKLSSIYFHLLSSTFISACFLTMNFPLSLLLEMS